MGSARRNLHAWTTRTAGGEKRTVRAQLFGKRWTLSSKTQGEEEWTAHAEPALEDLVELHAILMRKYQRKHLAWDHVVGVRALITARGGTLEEEG